MNELSELQRVDTLQEGKSYFLRLTKRPDGVSVYTQVKFVGYTSCPAIIIVQDTRKIGLRCSREDLFHTPHPRASPSKTLKTA